MSSYYVHQALKTIPPWESEKLRKIWYKLATDERDIIEDLIFLGVIISTYLGTNLYLTIINVINEAKKLSDFPTLKILERLFIDLLINKISNTPIKLPPLRNPLHRKHLHQNVVEDVVEDSFERQSYMKPIKSPIYEYIRGFKFYSNLSDEKIFKLKGLSLNNNQLTFIPESLGDLTNLQSLFLNDNQLTSLPESLGNLTNLRELWLSKNRLTSLPESLGNLSNLQSLFLNDNQLTSLPESLGNLTNLRELWLSNNRLTYLPESLGTLSNLKDLYLLKNNLNFQAKKVLKNLVMSNSVIRYLPTDEFDFSEELQRNKRGVPAPGRTTVKAVEF